MLSKLYWHLVGELVKQSWNGIWGSRDRNLGTLDTRDYSKLPPEDVKGQCRLGIHTKGMEISDSHFHSESLRTRSCEVNITTSIHWEAEVLKP